VPGVRLESLLDSIKNYDQHQRYFKEVEQSKLSSRDGDTYNIFLPLVRTKVVTVHYNTNYTAPFDPEWLRKVARLDANCVTLPA